MLTLWFCRSVRPPNRSTDVWRLKNRIKTYYLTDQLPRLSVSTSSLWKRTRKICVQLHKLKIIVFFHDRKSLLFSKQTCFIGVARSTTIDSWLACKYYSYYPAEIELVFCCSRTAITDASQLYFTHSRSPSFAAGSTLLFTEDQRSPLIPVECCPAVVMRTRAADTWPLNQNQQPLDKLYTKSKASSWACSPNFHFCTQCHRL